MKHSINQDNYYEDCTFGSYGIFIFGLLPSFFVLAYGIYMGCIALEKEIPAFTENYIGIVFVFICISSVCFGFVLIFDMLFKLFRKFHLMKIAWKSDYIF